MTDATGMDRWRDRVALVTGASSGIGTAVAKTLAGHGMKVALAARRKDVLEQLAGEIDTSGESVIVMPADLRDAGSIAQLFAAVREHWGGVDVMINNAGLGYPAPLLDGEADRWREMLDVNVMALSICTTEAVRDMRRRGDDGYVIHISSLSGHRVVGAAMYSASKYAVRALAEGLRQELHAAGSGVRVSTISPGFVETGFHEVFFGKADHGAYDRYPVLQASDIADAVEYLLSRPDHMQIQDILVRSRHQPS